MLHLLKTSSVSGLEAQLANLGSVSTSNTNAVSILNGGDTVVGSLAKLEKDSKAYTDAKVGDVDLSAVQANTDALAIINGDDTVDGSIAKVQKDAVAAGVAYVASETSPIATKMNDADAALVILNGDATVEGSIKHEIAAVVAGAPAELDTLKEIADALTTEENVQNALIATVAANKTASEDRDAALNTRIDEVVNTQVPAAVTVGKNYADAEIASAKTAAKTAADSTYFAKSALLGGLSAEDQTTLRGNIGAITSTEAATIANAARDTFHEGSKSVENGKVVLEASVTAAHVECLNIEYADNAYDTLSIVPIAGEAGAFKIYKEAEGDLDGTSIFAKYVEQHEA